MRWLLLFVISFAVSSLPSARLVGQEPELSAEGQARKAAHDYLFHEFSVGKELRFKGTEAARVLDEIVVSTKRLELSGDVVFELPEGSQRVASMFRYIILRGEGLHNLGGLVMLPYAPNARLAISTQEPTIYRAKVPSMPIPSDSMPPIRIRTTCRPGTTATITEIAFNSQGKLPTTFDDIPYRNLGAEFPRVPVEVAVDLRHELSIAGHVDLEREKFCRYYAAPGNLDSSFEQWAAERNFLPGRQIMKFQPALVERYSSNQPKLTERADAPGAADLSFFDLYDSGESIRRAIDRFRDIPYAMCFNDYPDFMSVKHVGRGTPLVECFDEAAELAAAYVADQIRDAGRSATWWEVKNESTIKSEWDYHWRKDVDSWGLLADFHNHVADAIHARSPETKVGGPSSAWMQLQAADFGLYRNQVRFMDLTRGHLDFYSHHFYEDFGTLGAWERRQGKYTNYLLGRLEAILDMILSHMHETDNVRPILITECGSLQPGRAPSDYWLRIRSYSAYMHKLMQRPQQIDLAVPFMFLSIPWNPTSGDAAFTPREGKPNSSPLRDCDSTPVAYVFELWRDFNGRRLPVAFDRPWLDATAVHKGNRVQIAMTNMGGRRLSINLSRSFDRLPVASATQRRLFYRDGHVQYEDAIPLADLAAIPVDVEETTIVTIRLERPLTIRGRLRRDTRYAPGTAIKTDDPSLGGWTIDVERPGALRAATLVIGVHREGGLGGPLVGKFNGHPVKIAADWADEFHHLFAPIEVPLPVEQLERTNHFELEPRDGLTVTSVSIVTERREEP